MNIEKIDSSSLKKSPPMSGSINDVTAGIVVKIETHPERRNTYVHIDFGSVSNLVVNVRGYADILGDRVVYNRKSREIICGLKNIRRFAEIGS